MESIAIKYQSSLGTRLKQSSAWILFGLSCLFLASCSLFETQSGTVQLVVQGLPADLLHSSSLQPGSTQSTRASLPLDSSFLSMSLTISGPSMSTQQYYYKSLPTSISITIPAGKARHFALDINVNPKLPSAALAFSGEQTVDLNPGESKAINFQMAISESKIIFPDYYRNGTGMYPRLIEMDNIKGENWIERDANNVMGCQPGNPTSFRPKDVDFDASGRIFIAASQGYSSYPKIVRFDNIAGFAATTIIDRYTATPSNTNDALAAEIETLAIDRKNNYLYYAYNDGLASVYELRKYDLTTNTFLPLPKPPAVLNFYQLAVDKDGFLYISCSIVGASAANYVIKCDPVTGTILKLFTSDLFQAGDMLIRDDYILVANYYLPASDGYMMLKLDTNLNFIKGYGFVANPLVNETRKGFFYRPARFVGLSRKKIWMIDDGRLSAPADANPVDPFVNRIITMDNIEDWSGWDFLYKTGTDHFMFFVC